MNLHNFEAPSQWGSWKPKQKLTKNVKHCARRKGERRCQGPEIVTKQSFKQFNLELFLYDLSLHPFSVSYIFEDPDEVYCRESSCNQVLDEHVSISKYKKRNTPGSKLIRTEIQKAMRKMARGK